MKKNRLLSLILAAVMLFSLSVTAAAAGFTDLENHWAKDYMENLVQRGYLNGYGNGLIGPEDNMTTAQTLALLSRLYTPSTEALTLMAEDNGEFVYKNTPKALEWFYDEAVLCLSVGIVTPSEYLKLELDKELTKELSSVFLVRAMGLEKEALRLDSSKLTFADAESINPAYAGHVALLYNLKIVTGDSSNKFDPSAKVKRCTMAAMLSRGLDYLEENKITLKAEKYEGQKRFSGIIRAVGSDFVRVSDTDALVREFAADATTNVTVKGQNAPLSAGLVGRWASMTSKDGKLVSITVESTTDAYVQGILVGISQYTDPRSVSISETGVWTATKYSLTDSAYITIDGRQAPFKNLGYGTFATAKLNGGYITELKVSTIRNTVSGVISSLEFGSIVSMKIDGDDGEKYCFAMDITELPTVTRGNITISVDRLAKGDKVVLSAIGPEVVSINAEGASETMSGTLIAMHITLNGTTWEIKDSYGSVKTLELEKAVDVYLGTKGVKLSDVNVGDSVRVSIYNNRIAEVFILSSTSSEGKVRGTLLTTNLLEKQMTMLDETGKLLYLNTTTLMSVTSASTGRQVAPANIPIGSQLLVYGSYSSSNVFDAVTIIIE